MPSQLKVVALLLLVSCLPACGVQLVGWADAGATADPPTVISTSPADSALAVDLTSPVSATFSQAMDPATLGPTTFTLSQEGAPVSGSVTYDAATLTATFTPEAPLAIDRRYTAAVTTGARDTEGRALVADHVWSFTSARLEVVMCTATAASVPAPDYRLDTSGLLLLTDADDVVQSATGAATLTAGLVTGQRYVVASAAGLNTHAALDGAYLAGADAPLTASLPAAVFALVGIDLTGSQVRTLIIANLAAGVRSYQAFEITFHPADE